jgi:hypothetical protein
VDSSRQKKLNEHATFVGPETRSNFLPAHTTRRPQSLQLVNSNAKFYTPPLASRSKTSPSPSAYSGTPADICSPSPPPSNEHQICNRYSLLTASPAAWTETAAVLPPEKGHRRRQPGRPHLAHRPPRALRHWPQVILFLFLPLVIPHFLILSLPNMFTCFLSKESDARCIASLLDSSSITPV